MVLFLKEKSEIDKTRFTKQSKKTRLSDKKPQCAWSEAYNPTDQKCCRLDRAV